MSKVLLLIAHIIAFCCAMIAWQFNFGIRIFIFDLLTVLFIVLSLIFYSVNRCPIFLQKELKYFLLFLWGWILAIALSSINVIFSPVGKEAFTQYFKGGTENLVQAIFFSFFVIFLSNFTNNEQRYTLLKTFIWGVIASSIYEILQLSLFVLYNIDLGSLIWETISYNKALPVNTEPTWSVMGLIRAGGFPDGPNAAATYVVTALPILLLSASRNRKFKNILFFIIALSGLLLTMSRTGMVSFGVAVLVLILLESKKPSTLLKILIIILIPIGIISYEWWDYINEILAYRTHIDYSRLSLYEHSLKLLKFNPLTGVGHNNFSVIRMVAGDEFIDEPNVHNGWLTILLELGIVGLLLEIAFLTFIVYVAYKRKSTLARAFMCTIIGLSFGALVNQVFDLFYMKFFIALAFIVIANEPGNNKPEKISFLRAL